MKMLYIYNRTIEAVRTD